MRYIHALTHNVTVCECADCWLATSHSLERERKEQTRIERTQIAIHDQSQEEVLSTNAIVTITHLKANTST